MSALVDSLSTRAVVRELDLARQGDAVRGSCAGGIGLGLTGRHGSPVDGLRGLLPL